jgi:uncharacterized phage protein (TIGR01671 family)
MKRDIEFRGKIKCSYDGKSDGKWAYGFYQKRGTEYLITNDRATYYIIPETVCEFTGLLDCKKVKIFEGDIIKLINGALFEICYGFFLPNFIKEYCKEIRRKPNKIIGFYGKHLAAGVEGAEGEEVVLTDYSAAYEVIGNIHDNPKLLDGI